MPNMTWRTHKYYCKFRYFLFSLFCAFHTYFLSLRYETYKFVKTYASGIFWYIFCSTYFIQNIFLMNISILSTTHTYYERMLRYVLFNKCFGNFRNLSYNLIQDYHCCQLLKVGKYQKVFSICPRSQKTKPNLRP